MVGFMARLTQALIVNNNRKATHKDYVSALRVLRATMDTNGPGDVDEEKAKEFVTNWMTGTSTRANADDAQTYERKHSVQKPRPRVREKSDSSRLTRTSAREAGPARGIEPVALRRLRVGS
jgi:hypothetical protein